MLNLTSPDGTTCMVECSGETMTEALGQGIEQATGWRLNWHLRTNAEPPNERLVEGAPKLASCRGFKAAWRAFFGRPVS